MRQLFQRVTRTKRDRLVLYSLAKTWWACCVVSGLSKCYVCVLGLFLRGRSSGIPTRASGFGPSRCGDSQDANPVTTTSHCVSIHVLPEVVRSSCSRKQGHDPSVFEVPLVHICPWLAVPGAREELAPFPFGLSARSVGFRIRFRRLSLLGLIACSPPSFRPWYASVPSCPSWPTWTRPRRAR